MILIGLGANLPSKYGAPRATLGAALDALNSQEMTITAVSPWYKTAPVPVSDQPWYVNGVAAISTHLTPEVLLTRLLGLENEFGRVRGEVNAARLIDIDLLDYDGVIRTRNEGAPTLPHPRLHERAFVVLPLAELAPDWCHPVSDQAVSDIVNALPPNQKIIRMERADGSYGTEWKA